MIHWNSTFNGKSRCASTSSWFAEERNSMWSCAEHTRSILLRHRHATTGVRRRPNVRDGNCHMLYSCASCHELLVLPRAAIPLLQPQKARAQRRLLELRYAAVGRKPSRRWIRYQCWRNRNIQTRNRPASHRWTSIRDFFSRQGILEKPMTDSEAPKEAWMVEAETKMREEIQKE